MKIGAKNHPQYIVALKISATICMFCFSTFHRAYIIDVYIYLYMRKKLKYCNGKSVAIRLDFWYNKER